MTTTATRPSLGVAYQPTAAVSRQALLSEGFSCILQGRPFPAALRPVSPACVEASTCAEGIATILAGARSA